LEDTDADVRTMFKWIFKKQNARVWVGLIWLKTGTRGEFFELTN
jgi:hypothetical protein